MEESFGEFINSIAAEMMTGVEEGLVEAAKERISIVAEVAAHARREGIGEKVADKIAYDFWSLLFAGAPEGEQ